MTGPTTHTLDVPGARLHYERRGAGPLLLLVGSPMDSGPFTPLATSLSARYTVVTYDPRGLGHSVRDDRDADITPEQQADDVYRLLAELGGGPAHLFGNSGGAVVGLALATAHPDAVTTLVAHEPPVIEALPDPADDRAHIADIYATYRESGAERAMVKFVAWTGLGGPPADPSGGDWRPSPEMLERMRAGNETFLGHLFRPTTGFRPDIDALRAASTRVVVGVGAESKGLLARRTAEALADRLGLTPVEFPGEHVGFIWYADEFARRLDRVLSEPAR